MKDVAHRMARAFEKYGFFIFEGEELQTVQKVLEAAKLSETLRVARLGEVELDLKNVKLKASYYIVTLDLESCLEKCSDGECLRKCVNERKEAVSRSLRELEVPQEVSDLSELLKRLSSRE
ncbi:MAG: hypothetical protein GXO07_03530 [Crenarchaeota archaeon]|nr:hypothetical protein [Thermoproteota archaeon]